MLTLVNDLLDISRIEAGKIELQRETVELPSFLAEIEKYNRMLGRRKRIQLEVNCEDGVPGSVPAKIRRLYRQSPPLYWVKRKRFTCRRRLKVSGARQFRWLSRQ